MPIIKKTVLGEIDNIKRREEESLAQNRAQKMGIQYLKLDTIPTNVSDLMLIPEKEARTAQVAVIKREGKVISLAALHHDDPDTKKIVAQFEDKEYKVSRIGVSFSSLEHTWEIYKLYKEKGEDLRKIFPISQDRTAELVKVLKTKREVEKKLASLEEDDTTNFLEVLFISGMQADANDIHIEPQEKGAKIRFRIDGVLQDITPIDGRLYRLTLNRLKVLAELKLNVTKAPQDGRFTVRKKGDKKNDDIEVRLSLIPSYFGQTIVMRLLGVAVSLLEITKLGMEPQQQEALIANLSLPNGMILTTGPTGSGKTTLLYAALEYVKKPEINIITIENPVEYKVEGITQTQVNKEKGYTFETGLQSILRQDPDVVLVGEIRSEETAETAINAALTGHLVFSTLHTNDAPGSIERFINLKVRVNLIPAAVQLVLAQRLVRRLCPNCRKQAPLPTNNKEAIKRVISLISPRSHIKIPRIPETMHVPGGCDACFGTGYAGRTGIFELFELNDVVEQKILSGVTTYELRKTAIENGMLTLLQHGILKMLRGETSLEEIQRIAGDSAYIEELYGQAVVSILSRSLVVTEATIREITSLPSLTPEKMREFFDNLPEEKYMETFLALGTHLDASDLHIEPKEDHFEIKYRVDGVLQHFASLRSELFTAFIETIRELSGMKIGVHKKIQEGRFSSIIGGEEFHIDVRVSLIPGGFGETVVLRILKQEFTFSLEKLGIPGPVREKLEKEVRQPNGLILATGPTGSGKSTTLHSMLKLTADGRKKIITIENPIEYKNADVIQTQIDKESGYDFPEAIRAILRQDPDIILVGEIRDNLTAKTAFQASSTGHLVFSTLHTNDALGILERLYSLDMPAEQVASVLNIVIAQRLARKLCVDCKKAIDPSSELKEKMVAIAQGMPDYIRPTLKDSFTIFEPQGCQKCSDTGFKGRIGIFEIIFFSESLKELVHKKAGRSELINVAKEAGAIFFKEDAILKLLGGATSLSEVENVIGSL